MTKHPQEIRRAVRSLAEGRVEEAQSLCDGVLARDALDAAAMHLLGLVHQRRGAVELAVEVLLRSTRLPGGNTAEYRANLAAALGAAGRVREAEGVLRSTLSACPDHAASQLNLGVLLDRAGRAADAERHCRRAVELRPDHGPSLAALANVLRKREKWFEAADAYTAALERDPGVADTHSAYARVLQAMGRAGEAVCSLRRAVALAPAGAHLHGDLACAVHYDPAATPQTLMEEARAWARAHGRPEEEVRPDPVTGRRLRVGYLSPDLRDHAVGRLLVPVLEAHDRAAVEVFVYCDAAGPAAITDRAKVAAEHWRVVAGQNDDEVLAQIRGDRIDVLVETAGYFAGHRLAMLSQRAAAVQVSGFGYCGTTGVPAIDYRLTDPYSDPPGVTDPYHSERLLRLPDCANCYRPVDPSPAVGPLPALANGRVTFCCLNTLTKINDCVVDAWARIMAAVPDARLVLLASPHDAYMRRRFAERGIDGGRVELVGRLPRYDYLDLHNRCDLALDTFPFNGDNTTFDALWMGVPTITLAGDRFAGRRGLSHAENLGHPEWVATTPDEYVEKAVAWAGDLERLARVRVGLRDAFRASPLGDVERWTRNLEAAYRHAFYERRAVNAGDRVELPGTERQ